MANRKQERKVAAAESVRADKEKATASVTGTDKKPAAKKPAVKKPVVKKPKVLPAEREAKAPMAKRAARVTKRASEGKSKTQTPGRVAASARVAVAKKQGDQTRAATKKAEVKLVPGVKAGAPTWARTRAGREMMSDVISREQVTENAADSLNNPDAVRVDPAAKPRKRVRPSGTSRTPKPSRTVTQADVRKARSKNQKYRFRGN